VLKKGISVKAFPVELSNNCACEKEEQKSTNKKKLLLKKETAILVYLI
jgi:hypothetical protein